jgi:nucleotide-binding universal stress UspA family protein
MSEQPRTIVVGVDGSDPSMRALEFAVGLAEDLNHTEVVAVFARHGFLALPPDVGDDVDANVLDRVEQTVKDTVAQHFGGKSVAWTFEVELGRAADVLCDVAERHGASFIVAGRTGWSAYHDILLGSVAARVAHRANRPVMLVP